jgi:hypothetical protein
MSKTLSKIAELTLVEFRNSKEDILFVYNQNQLIELVEIIDRKKLPYQIELDIDTHSPLVGIIRKVA